MTVKELEDALGMTRANIRFYEREGLIAPARQENGYRDYTPEDLDTLKRIKLLRQLQFTVEEIRAIQRGQRDLADALRGQEARLRQEARDLEAARDLCRQIEREGVPYPRLNADKYLEEMERLTREGARFQGVEADALPTVSHPWRRFFARGLDFALCGLLLDAALALPFRARPGDGIFWSLLIAYLTWAILFGLEPLLLSTWGYTPGKWLFGLTVRGADGGKLTFGEAFARLSGVFGSGEGYGIPIYNLYRNYKSYTICASGELLPWDGDIAYTIRDLKVIRCCGFVAARAAVWALAVLLGIHTLMPPVRSSLTVADFARNYNDLQAQLGGWYRLDEEGRWQEENRDNGVIISFGREGLPPEYTYHLENGRVTGLSFVAETAGDWVGEDRQETAVLALLAARPEVNLFNWTGVIRELDEALGREHENYSVTLRGLTITNRVEYSGYEDLGDYLIAREGQVQRFHQEFRIETAQAD